MVSSIKSKRSLYERFWDLIIPETPTEREFFLAEAELLREHARTCAAVAERQEIANKRARARDPEELARQAELKKFRPVAYCTINAQRSDKPIRIHVSMEENSLKERQMAIKVYNDKGQPLDSSNTQSFVEGTDEYRQWIGPWVDKSITNKALKDHCNRYGDYEYLSNFKYVKSD